MGFADVSSVSGGSPSDGSLAEAASRWEEGVTRLLSESEELAEYVGRLEAAADEAMRPGDGGEEPSGEALAAEVERFLREQERGT